MLKGGHPWPSVIIIIRSSNRKTTHIDVWYPKRKNKNNNNANYNAL